MREPLPPDGGRRRRHQHHDARGKWYSYYRSLRFSRHYGTYLWQQLEVALNEPQHPADLTIYRVLLFDRQHIENLLRQST